MDTAIQPDHQHVPILQVGNDLEEGHRDCRKQRNDQAQRQCKRARRSKEAALAFGNRPLYGAFSHAHWYMKLH